MSVENVVQCIINAWPSHRLHYLSYDSKNCCAKFRFIVPPQNTISSGKFSALGPWGTAGWSRIITGNPNGQGWEVLVWGGGKRPFPKSWLVSSSAGASSLLVRVDINQSILRFPSSLKLFLRRGGGIELQANSCNRSPRQPRRRKHSIIHTSLPDTRLHDTKTEATKRRDTCFVLFCYQTSEPTENMVWCDLFLGPSKDEDLRGIFHRD